MVDLNNIYKLQGSRLHLWELEHGPTGRQTAKRIQLTNIYKIYWEVLQRTIMETGASLQKFCMDLHKETNKRFALTGLFKAG